MKDLYTYINEGVLDDIENTMDTIDDKVDNLTVFGKYVTFSGITGLTAAAAGMFNSIALKRNTKNLDYINYDIEHGVFDKQNKVKMFTNWLDHLKFEDLGLTYNCMNSDSGRLQLTDELNKQCEKLGFFNSDKVKIWIPTITNYEKGRLRIFIHRTDKLSTGINIHYEIK